MLRHRLFPLAVVLVCAPSLFAEHWAIGLDVGMNNGVAAAMHGNAMDFQNDLARDYTNRWYPFGDARASNWLFGGTVRYRVGSGDWSVVGGVHETHFHDDNGLGGALESHANLNVLSLGLGAEWAFWGSDGVWKTFVRGGVDGSSVSGDVRYWGSPTTVPAEFRLGFDLAAGGRYRVPHAPLDLEVSVGYSNVNLIGKSYVPPPVRPPQALPERALNDAANPQAAQDAPRVIDYLGYRLGLALEL